MGFSTTTSNVAPLIYAMETRRDRLLVQEFKKCYLLNLLMRSAKPLQFKGRTIQVPYYIGGPPAAGRWINSTSILPEPKRSVPVMGYFSHRYSAWPFGFNQLDRLEVAGDPNQLIQDADLQAVEAAWGKKRMFHEGLWNGTGGLMPDGLLATIQAAAPGSQTGSYSGISRSTNPWLYNNYVEQTVTSGHIAPGTSLPAIILSFIAMIDAGLDGTRTPSHIVTNKNIIRLLRRAMAEIEGVYRGMMKREDADFGHLQVMVEGVPVGWDPLCPADTAISLHLTDAGKKNSLRTTNVKDDPNDLDEDLETTPGVNNVMDLDGRIGLIRHPNITNKKVDSRMGAKNLTEWNWELDSFNIAFPRLSNTCRLGSSVAGYLEIW